LHASPPCPARVLVCVRPPPLARALLFLGVLADHLVQRGLGLAGLPEDAAQPLLGLARGGVSADDHRHLGLSALGLEGISIEWIVKSLKPGGKAFVVIPDGILGRVGDKKLRDFILKECVLDAIVSLPVRTFFANFEHTYILSLTKKNTPSETQSEPVFTYLVSNIGERLTSVKREEIDENDLPEMEKLFRIFMAARSSCRKIIEDASPRCKVWDIDRFRSPHWVIDRWWTRDEKIAIGMEEATGTAAIQELESVVQVLAKSLREFEQVSLSGSEPEGKSKDVKIGDWCAPLELVQV